MGPSQRSQYREALCIGQLGVRNPAGTNVFIFSKSVHIAPTTNPISRKMGTLALSWGKSTRAWM